MKHYICYTLLTIALLASTSSWYVEREEHRAWAGIAVDIAKIDCVK